MTFERAFFVALGFLAETLDFMVLAFTKIGLVRFFFTALALVDFVFTGLRFATLELAGFTFIDFTFVVFVFALAFLAMFVSYPLSDSHPLVDRGLNSFSLLAMTSDDKVMP